MSSRHRNRRVTQSAYSFVEYIACRVPWEERNGNVGAKSLDCYIFGALPHCHVICASDFIAGRQKLKGAPLPTGRIGTYNGRIQHVYCLTGLSKPSHHPPVVWFDSVFLVNGLKSSTWFKITLPTLAFLCFCLLWKVKRPGVSICCDFFLFLLLTSADSAVFAIETVGYQPVALVARPQILGRWPGRHLMNQSQLSISCFPYRYPFGSFYSMLGRSTLRGTDQWLHTQSIHPCTSWV